MMNLTNDELCKVKDAVYQISDAFYALKEVRKNCNTNSGDLGRLINDLKEMIDEGSLTYFLQKL